MYFIVGELYRLDFGAVIKGFDASLEVEVAGVPGAEELADGRVWQFRPASPGDFTLQVTVKNRDEMVLATESREVVVLGAPRRNVLRHLSIGDSITRAGSYAHLAVACILGGRTVGTRSYDGGTINVEGRGGWTSKAYISNIGLPSGGDSPFLFPEGISGHKYWGNTAFWADVTARDPEGYDYDGFQLIAKNWNDNGDYIFDARGYPTTPAVGDVVVDPSLPPSQQWREYDGESWNAKISPSIEVSFAKYLDRFSEAFADGVPTSISIMLGTVDFLLGFSTSEWTEYSRRIDGLIGAIRAWNAHVPIVIIAPPVGGLEQYWADKGTTGADFNRRMVDLAEHLYIRYDTPASREQKINVVSFLGVVSSENMADYVHPKDPEGHAQMAPWLAGVLGHLVSTGIV